MKKDYLKFKSKIKTINKQAIKHAVQIKSTCSSFNAYLHDNDIINSNVVYVNLNLNSLWAE